MKEKRIEFITDYLRGNEGVFQGTQATLIEDKKQFTIRFDNGVVFGHFSNRLKKTIYKKIKEI